MKNKKNINNIFYGVIGVATLMLAIIGATFAYFTATATNNVTITGNMATISFDVTIGKVTSIDDEKGGLIPMSNNMVEQALNRDGTAICADDNGNAVCQVYKIHVINESSASIFVDGYVTLKGGSGVPTDITGEQWLQVADGTEPTMRWAQAFCTESSGTLTNCTTGGNSTVRPATAITYSTLGTSATAKADGHNLAEIKLAADKASIVTTANISALDAATMGTRENNYEVLNTNYIRISDHLADDYKYERANDVTSALVWSQFLQASNTNDTDNTGDKNSTYTDAQVYYIVVWLSENGHNQTAGATNADADGEDFFTGNVTFISSEGYEVTATFSNRARVKADTPIS